VISPALGENKAINSQTC